MNAPCTATHARAGASRWTRQVNTLLVCLLTCLTLAVAASAAPPPGLERKIFAAFDQANYARAAELIEQYLEDAPRDTTMLYNAACAYSRLEERDRAASFLFQSVEAGFVEFDLMRRDPDLEGLRDHPTYQAILEAADQVTAQIATNALDRWKNRFGDEAYRYETDTDRRLHYATALDLVTHREMRQMVELQADQMIDSLFKSPPTYDNLIAIPTPEDASELFYSPDIGGLYEPTRHRLIARDIGTALRHELFHLMHHGHMRRLGQEHPIWIQEGIASLYEDYELSAGGQITFLPNQRHNIVRARARTGRVMKWPRLFRMDHERFMSRAGVLYAQVRSIFEFVAEQRQLERWYATYIEHFDEDPTGTYAFELTFHQPLEEIEIRWRRWVQRQPVVDVDIRMGDAVLGVETQPRGSNDGVVVTRVMPGSGAARAGVRRGDIIVALDGRPTRSLMELRTVIGTKEPGDRARIRVRRDGTYLTLSLTMRAFEPQMIP